MIRTFLPPAQSPSRHSTIDEPATLDGQPFRLHLELSRTRRGWLFHCQRCHRRAAALYLPSKPLRLACRVRAGLPQNHRIPKSATRLGRLVSGHYAALVDTLMTLRNRPDGLGETYINAEEAARIRACGFSARPNTIWRAPILPDHLLRGNPWLDQLSDQYDDGFRGGWHPKRAAARFIIATGPS
jgi:hypothetical protein